MQRKQKKHEEKHAWPEKQTCISSLSLSFFFPGSKEGKSALISFYTPSFPPSTDGQSVGWSFSFLLLLLTLRGRTNERKNVTLQFKENESGRRRFSSQFICNTSEKMPSKVTKETKKRKETLSKIETTVPTVVVD